MKTDAAEMIARARVAQLFWSQLSVRNRCHAIRAMRRQIAKQCDAIASLIAQDACKHQLDALSGDVLTTLEQMRFYERNAASILRERHAGKPTLLFSGTRFFEWREPFGVVLIVAPSNYPFQLALIPTITALIAGNAVVLKCSERCPATAQQIAQLCGDHLPENLVQVLHSDSKCCHKLIDAAPDLIFFTGSSKAGEQVAQHAARLLLPTILELGGKDAALVFADCNLDRTVEGIVYGAYSNAGRVCVATKRLYVEQSIYGFFLERLAARIKTLRLGNDANSDFGALPEAHLEEFCAQVQDALSRGATLHLPADRKAFAGSPVLLADVPPDARILTEESFGPALCIAPFRGEAEAIALANRTEFALSASVWTRDRVRGRRVAAQLSAGSCAINDVIRNIANPSVAFGGNRKSGYGRYHGPEGLLTFSRTKTVMQARGRRIRERNWFPFNARTMQQLSALIRIRHAGLSFLSKVLALLPALAISLISSPGAAARQPVESHLAIKVDIPPQPSGQLAFLIFTSPSGFPGARDKAFRHGFVAIPQNASAVEINADLPPGTYAVTVYEDRNENGKLDHNLLGMPREPVGASNNPRPRFGPPRFSDCSFQLGASPLTISIHLVEAS